MASDIAKFYYINIISGVQEAGVFNQKKNVTISLIAN